MTATGQSWLGLAILMQATVTAITVFLWKLVAAVSL
jgi:hypothetical protein